MISQLIRWPSFHVSIGLKLKNKKIKKKKEIIALTIESLKQTTFFLF